MSFGITGGLEEKSNVRQIIYYLHLSKGDFVMVMRAKRPDSSPQRLLQAGNRKKVMGFAALSLAIFMLFSLYLSGCTRGRNSTGPPSADPGSSLVPDLAEPQEPDEDALEGMFLVSIGNNPSGRPQSGLSEAAVVFEVPAEGGMTRLMAGFDKKVEKIGPVRSARKPLVQIAVGFDIPFAHCGGSEDSFEIIRAHKTKSLDEIYSAGECFWRSNDRSAPDNLYTSITKIEQGASRRGFASFHPEFYATGELQGTPALGVSYAFSNSSKYPNLVEYRYEDSGYIRFINGREHVNDKGESIAPKTLAFLQVYTEYLQGKAIEVGMDVTGKGKALFFSNGVMCEGTWSKPSLKEPIQFHIGDNGEGLEEGLLWIHLVPDLAKIVIRASLGE